MNAKSRDGTSKPGFEVPDSLSFLSPDDYTRLTADDSAFSLHRNPGDHRNPFERDRARVLHSPFFRSLGGKSQVFDPNQSYFFRTRLTHSVEAAQIAKAMAVELCENYRASGTAPELSPWEQLHFCDLVEAVSLAHDLGHPPFGHTGEATLNRLMQEHRAGGFEANAQTLRVLTKLDRPYPGRPGFTRGVLAGVMKYKVKRSVGLSKFVYDDDWDIVQMACPSWRHDDALRQAPSNGEFQAEVRQSRTLACQVMDLADEITYAGHDIEDALHTTLLRYGSIEAIAKLADDISQQAFDDIALEVQSESRMSLSPTTMEEGWAQLQSSILAVLRAGNPSEFMFRSHKLRRTHMNAAAASSRRYLPCQMRQGGGKGGCMPRPK